MKPNCTEILRVEPIAPDGPERESLSSLIIRTAAENDVSPAILLEQKYGRNETLKGMALTTRAMGRSIGQRLNGSGAQTLKIVTRTEELTRLNNLRSSTTLNFTPFSTINGLVRQRLAWSPEFLANSETPYYPLTWAVDAVRVCTQTKRPLVSLCPGCREPLNMLAGASQIGICNKCKASLAGINANATDPISAEVKDLEYELWIADQIGDFVKFQTTEKLPPDFGYRAVLQFWLTTYSLTDSKMAARHLGSSPAAFFNWLHDSSIPKLRMTLNLSWMFGVSLLDYLLCRIPKNHDGKLRESRESGVRYSKPFRRRPIDRAKLEAQLMDVIWTNKYATMPFREICQKKLKRRDLVVRQLFPELARQLGRRYLDNKRMLAEAGRELVCCAIKAISRKLASRGITPNHKTLRPYLERPSLLRCEWAMAALTEVRTELGYEDRGEQLLLAV